MEDLKKKETKDLLEIAKTLIEKAKNNETITFSELCEKALNKELNRGLSKYIARRLDIIGHCCKENDFPFINGLTREKYSYKINSGFWQPFWKKLLPIKSYGDQTEENVKEFQQEIFDKIKKMTEEKIKEFLEKLEKFEPIYEDLNKKNDEYKATNIINKAINDRTDLTPEEKKGLREYTHELRIPLKREIEQQILKYADGKCEYCKNEKMTFEKENGENYLEIHHIKHYSDCKKEGIEPHTLDNLAVLCPKCHKEIHFGKKDVIQEMEKELKEKVKKRTFN